MTRYTEDIDVAVDEVISDVGSELIMALPLGLGKANHFANVLFKRALSDPALKLHIVTALTLEVPATKDILGKRFLEPVIERLYAGYPELDYATVRRRGNLPANVTVSEFFLNSGQLLRNKDAQCHYLSSNYTHAIRDLLDLGTNVIAQQIAPHANVPYQYSLSCNPDVTLDLVKASKETGHKLYIVGQVNNQLPYLHGDAEVNESFFDLIVTQDRKQPGNHGDFPLFAVPPGPVALSDYAIATHVSSLIKDGGTLQIGIGSMGDAIAYILALRHHNNSCYRRLLDGLFHDHHRSLRPRLEQEDSTFQQGLYANTEMFVEGLLYLRLNNVLTRRVYPDTEVQSLLNDGLIRPEVSPDVTKTLLQKGRIHLPLSFEDFNFLQSLHCIPASATWREGDVVIDSDTILTAKMQTESTIASLGKTRQGQALGSGSYCHAGFYIGSQNFYQQLRDLDNDSRNALNMCSVNYTNHLYSHEALKRAQRQYARYVNTGMMATLTGAVISDGLKNYQVVSGVGGQYNFVAQAHELQGGRSIICLHSTRTVAGKTQSNIVWDYPHITIPRHLRDIVVTEYGAADLRGLSDREVIAKMLCITDSRFQTELLKKAVASGKIEPTFEVPIEYRSNYPSVISAIFEQESLAAHLPYYPMGSDFSLEEMRLSVALKALNQKKGNYKQLFFLLVRGFNFRRQSHYLFEKEIKRMKLDGRFTFGKYFYRLLLLGELSKSLDTSRPLTKTPV